MVSRASTAKDESKSSSSSSSSSTPSRGIEYQHMGREYSLFNGPVPSQEKTSSIDIPSSASSANATKLHLNAPDNAANLSSNDSDLPFKLLASVFAPNRFAMLDLNSSYSSTAPDLKPASKVSYLKPVLNAPALKISQPDIWPVSRKTWGVDSSPNDQSRSTDQQILFDISVSDQIWGPFTSRPNPAKKHSFICDKCHSDMTLIILEPCQDSLCNNCTAAFIAGVESNKCKCVICNTYVQTFKTFGENVLLNGGDPFFSSVDDMMPQHLRPRSLSPSRPIEELIINRSITPPNSQEDILATQPITPPTPPTVNNDVYINSPMSPPPGLGDNTGTVVNPTSFQELAKKATKQDWPVVKISNIPWDISMVDMINFLGIDSNIISFEKYGQPVHIIMDRMSGKTHSCAYVEFESKRDAENAVRKGNQRLLKTRIVTMSISSQEELMTEIFPSWPGYFVGNNPCITDYMKARGFDIPNTPFLTRDEINMLILMSRGNNALLSRKSAERPFENLISIVCKFPWHCPEYYTALNRDHIFEALKLSIESLRSRVHDGKLVVHYTLLERMMRVVLLCPLFTDRQKMTVVETARIPCPHDLQNRLVPQQPRPAGRGKTSTSTSSPESSEIDRNRKIHGSFTSTRDGKGKGRAIETNSYTIAPERYTIVEPEVYAIESERRDFSQSGDYSRRDELEETLASRRFKNLGSTLGYNQGPPRFQREPHMTQLKLFKERLRREQEKSHRVGNSIRSHRTSGDISSRFNYFRASSRSSSTTDQKREPLMESLVEGQLETRKDGSPTNAKLDAVLGVFGSVPFEALESKVRKIADEHDLPADVVKSILESIQLGKEDKENQ